LKKPQEGKQEPHKERVIGKSREWPRLRIGLIPPLWARLAPGTSGGAENAVHLLANELVKCGHDVTVFASSDALTNAKVAAVSEKNIIEKMERNLAWEYEYYETCNIAEALARSEAFDVLHFHVGCYAIPLGQLSGCAVLHSLHNPVTPDAVWLLERYPDAAVTSVGRRQINVIPEPRRRGIRVVHNACDLGAYEFSPGPGKYLAFLGRISPEKGPHEAIRIAQQAGLPVVLAGQPLQAYEKDYFAEKIEPLIDGTNVIYAGPVDHQQKVDLLKNAAALLFPVQWDEPFGIVMIEAMACGTPVLAIRRGSVEEVVDVGRTGYHADSVEELTRLVPNALALERRRVRRHAQERFSHERMVNEYLEIYADLLSGRQTAAQKSRRIV
jgi:glycosyltransferase involved in cell wall biosynthesis